MEVDFIRHAESDITVHDDQTRPLTPKGRVQARQLVKQLKQYQYQAIYSSPLKRAVATIQPLASQLNLPVVEDDRLIERKMPGWCADFNLYLRQQWTDLDFAATGGESIHEVQRRYLAFLASLPDSGPIAIASHGTAMSGLVELTMPGQGYAYFNDLSFAAVTRFNYTNGSLVLLGVKQ